MYADVRARVLAPLILVLLLICFLSLAYRLDCAPPCFGQV